MKKILSLMFLLCLGLGMFSSCDLFDDESSDDTTVDGIADCSVSGSVEDLYKDDATRLALGILQSSTSTSGQINIPEPLVTRMLNALSVVHESDFAARDSVVNVYDIHVLDSIALNGLALVLDTSYAWVQDWKAGTFVTGNNDAVQALVSTYGLTLDNYIEIPGVDGTVASVSIGTTIPVNVKGLAEEFSEIEGVLNAVVPSGAIDGNNITAVDNGTVVELTYSVGYDLIANVCEGECDFRRSWIFQVVLDECKAVFVNATGDPAPGN